MNIKDMYVQANKIFSHGIQGYQVKPKYQHPFNQAQSQDGKPKRYQTKRGNYLDDYNHIHGPIPGPGKYLKDINWKRPKSANIKYGQKKTYIAQLVQRQKKQKRPAPGHYKLFKSLKQLDQQKKALAAKKVKAPQRGTYLDQVQYQAASTPGVGNYNVRSRNKTQQETKSRVKPQDWIKKHDLISKRKPNKTPDMGSYNPDPVNYRLFSSVINKSKKKSMWGTSQRFKTSKQGSGLGPGKYIKMEEWAHRYPVGASNPKSVYYQ